MLMKRPVCLMMSSSICLIVEPSSELKLKIFFLFFLISKYNDNCEEQNLVWKVQETWEESFESKCC